MNTQRSSGWLDAVAAFLDLPTTAASAATLRKLVSATQYTALLTD